MANNYMQFSFEMAVDTGEGSSAASAATVKCDLDKLLGGVGAAGDDDDADSEDGFSPGDVEVSSATYITEACKEGTACVVTIYDMDSGDIDVVIEAVQRVIDKYNVPGIHVLGYCYCCDRPRVDNFGGGAVAMAAGREPVYIDAAQTARETMRFAMEVPADGTKEEEAPNGRG